jgi:cytidine deaminase
MDTLLLRGATEGHKSCIVRPREADPGLRVRDVLDSPHSLGDLKPADVELYEDARSASLKARPTISRLHVGAALRIAGGSTFCGFNIEDASLWQVIHAEQSAVFAAISERGPEVDVREIAVYSAAASSPPCGACRQLLSEFGMHIRVIFPFRGRVIVKSVADLLPFAFEFETPDPS